MILPALTEYYKRLVADPDIEVSETGFSRQKIAFIVVVEKNGKLVDIQDARQQKGTKLVPQMMIVPGGAKPSGQGINPCFLWDNSAYMLGYKPGDDKPDRTLQTCEAFRNRHLDLEKDIGDEQFTAVCMFLKTWNPANEIAKKLDEIGTGFGVFRVQGETGFVHERPKIKQWWLSRLNNTDTSGEIVAQCLITGELAAIARVHEPKIKGVGGAQSSGASIVSFNFDAAESYGRSQSYNAPVSGQATFAYCVALNRLLDSPQRLRIGDTTTVYWTEKPSPIEDIFGRVMDSNSAEDGATRTQLHSIMNLIRQGGYPNEFGKPDVPFFVLGLSPNAARISVRFWYESTVGEMVEKLHLHFSDLQIAGSDRDQEFPAAWQLLNQTARESKDIPPMLAGALMRSILNGTPYPEAMFAAILRRIRADRRVVYLRVAFIKAFLNRFTRQRNLLKKEIDMALDAERPETAYHLGRLFAELEKTQEDALKGINDTIKDKYFGAASATPGSVFPRLIRLSQHHLGKLGKGSRIWHETRIQEICSRFDRFPSNLNLYDQGLFALGYYHQRQEMFVKKDKPESHEAEPFVEAS